MQKHSFDVFQDKTAWIKFYKSVKPVERVKQAGRTGWIPAKT
jgi:hypothetical protein